VHLRASLGRASSRSILPSPVQYPVLIMLCQLNLSRVCMQVLVGVRFLRQWPFIGRVRVCFVEPPYFQMTVKPLFGHGLDVTELPGISGWLVSMTILV
jgi:Ca2+-dependent lipid-binding protein